MKPLKITGSLLLLLQAFHLVCLQNSTDSPGRTIDKSWLRKPPKNEVQGENAATSGDSEFDQGADQTAGFSTDGSSGTASGFMTEEEEILTTPDNSGDSSDIMPYGFGNETAEETKLTDEDISLQNGTAESSNSSQTNMTGTGQEFDKSMTADNTTRVGDVSNETNSVSTTTTEKSATTATQAEDTDTSAATTAAPEIYRSTTKSLTTIEPSGTERTSPVTTSTAVSDMPGWANKTGKLASGSDRGYVGDGDSGVDPYRGKRNVAWLAVLGTAAATAVVGLLAYIILKKKHQKAFTHRKLVEEYPSDPVLRLDNCEPLDLNYGSYSNPALQGDSIQMTNIPGRH